MNLRPVVLGLLLAAGALPQAAAQQPEAFVRNLYAEYKTHDGPSGPRTYSPELLRLMKVDRRRAGRGNVGKLDFDPLCSCQDAEGLQVLAIRANGAAPHPLVSVTLKFEDGTRRQVDLKLMRIGKNRRVEDVGTNKVPSLLHYLE